MLVYYTNAFREFNSNNKQGIMKTLIKSSFLKIAISIYFAIFFYDANATINITDKDKNKFLVSLQRFNAYGKTIKLQINNMQDPYMLNVYKAYFDKFDTSINYEYKYQQSIPQQNYENFLDNFKSLLQPTFLPYFLIENKINKYLSEKKPKTFFKKKSTKTNEDNFQNLSILNLLSQNYQNDEISDSSDIKNIKFKQQDSYLHNIFKSAQLNKFDLWHISDIYSELLTTDGIETKELKNCLNYMRINSQYIQKLTQTHKITLQTILNYFHSYLFLILEKYSAEPVKLHTLTEQQKTALRPIFFKPFNKKQKQGFFKNLHKSQISAIKPKLKKVLNYIQTQSKNKKIKTNLYFLIDTTEYAYKTKKEAKKFKRNYNLLWLSLEKDKILIGMYPASGLLLVYSVPEPNAKMFLLYFLQLIYFTMVQDITQNNLDSEFTTYDATKLKKAILNAVFAMNQETQE